MKTFFPTLTVAAIIVMLFATMPQARTGAQAVYQNWPAVLQLVY